MATLTGQTIASTYDGLLKLSDNDGLTASVKNIEDGFGVGSPVNISTAVLFIKPTSDTSSTPTSGKEFEVVGNSLFTGDVIIDNIKIDGNTISAESGVVTLADGAIATTQSQSDNSTKIATTAYVRTAVGGVDTLSEILTNGNTTGGNNIVFGDSATIGTDDTLIFGAGNDLRIAHNGTDSVIRNFTGDLFIDQEVDDGDIIFRSDNGSGDKATYYFLDGSTVMNRFVQHVQLDDNIELRLGTNQDLRIEHTGSDGTITNFTGSLTIQNNTDDSDIIFKSDNGSGGTVEYFKLDGSLVNGTTTLGAVNFPDKSKIFMGAGADLAIYHDGSNSFVQDRGTGGLFLEGNGEVRIRKSETSEIMAKFIADGAVELYHDNSKKFETTSTGANITDDEFNLGDGAYQQVLFDTSPSSVIGTGTMEIQPTTAPGSGTANFTTYFKSKVASGTTNHNIKVDGTATFGGEVDLGTNTLSTGNVIIDGFDNSKYLSLRASVCCQDPAGSGGVGLKALDHNGSSADGLGVYGHDGISFLVGQTERARIDSSGRVGIGIAPTKKLTVFGTGAGEATVQIEGEGGADPYINFLANNTQHFSLGIDDSDGDKFKLSKHSALGTNDYLVVDTSGNSTFAGRVIIGDDAITTDKPGLVVGDTTNGGQITIRGLSPTLFFDKTGSNNPKILTDGGLLEIKSGDLDSEGSVLMSLTGSSGNATFAGDVVIGVADSGERKLKIHGGASGSPEGGQIELHTAEDHDSSYAFYRIDAYEDDLRIGRAGTTDITLQSTGNVLFAGNITLNTATVSDSVFTQFIKSNSSVRIDIDSDNNQTDRSFLVSKHNAGTELMRINEDGNIGISQSSPISNINSGSFFKPDSNGRFLTLNGAANGSFIMLESSSTTDDDQIGGVYFTATGGQGDAHKQVAGIDAIVYAHGTTSLNGADLRFFTKPAGAGQTSPALILEHNSNATFAGTLASGNISVTGGGGGNGQIDVLRTSGANVRIQSQSAAGVLGVTTNHPLQLKTNDTTAITISTGQLVTFAGNINLGDSKKIRFGAGEYLQIQHNGTDSQITSIAGHLQFTNTDNDKDITFATDDGSGGDTEYFRIDGGAEKNIFSKPVELGDLTITGTLSGAGSFVPVGGGTFTGDVTISKAATPLFKLLDTTNNVNLLLGADDTNTFLRGSSGSLIFQTNGANAALTLDDSQGAVFAANVFLGDGKKLNFGAAPDFEIFHNNTSNVNVITSLLSRQMNIQSDTLNITNQAASTTYLGFASGGAATFAGRVTVGTGVTGNSTSGGQLIIDSSNSFKQLSFSSDVSGETEGVTGMVFVDDTGNNQNDLRIGGGLGENNAMSKIRFFTASNNTTRSGTERLRIQGTGEIAIGTTSASEKLEIVGGSVYVNSEDQGFIADNGAKRVGLMKYAGREGVISRVANQDFEIVRTSGSDIFDGSSLTTDLYVGAAGDVSVGSTSHEGKFTVVGATQTCNFDLDANAEVGLSVMGVHSTNFVGMTIGSANSTKNSGVFRFKYNGAGSNNNYVGIGLYAADDILNVTGGGNVGINTTQPSYKLDIISVGADAINVGAGNDFSGVRWTGDNHAFSWRIGGDSFFIYDVINAAQRVTIKDNGNVGIGEDAPDNKLHVKGGSTTRVKIESSGTNTGILLNEQGTDRYSIASTSNGTFQIFSEVASVNRLSISSAGDVQIGSSGTSNLYFGNTISASSADRGMRIHTNNANVFFDFQGEANDELFFRDYDGSGGIHTRHEFGISNGALIIAGGLTQNGSPSDIKYKENIKTISNGIDKIEKLNPVEFDWNDKSDAHKIGKKEDAGFIAQEVQKVLPNLVNENVDGDLVLNYQGIIPYLVQSIQELKKEIEILKSK